MRFLLIALRSSAMNFWTAVRLAISVAVRTSAFDPRACLFGEFGPSWDRPEART